MGTTVTYDTENDVLYVRFEDKPATSSIEDGHGRVWRFDAAEKIVGVTFIDFTARLGAEDKA